jgi:two-component system, OmpR family, KDP operon response regulator KdpE
VEQVIFGLKERILAIDDDIGFLTQTHRWLQKSGYEVVTSKSGASSLRRLFTDRPDLVLLDTNLSEINSWEVCRIIREMSNTPIIMLTANSQKADILKGFSLGADDFVNKPPDFPELIARVRAVLRRYKANRPEEKLTVFHHPEIEVDWRIHQVLVRGQSIKLSPTEFKLLTCLIENRGWLVTHEELLRKVWGPDYVDEKGFVKLYVRYLRQKIEKNPGRPQLILTERGIGYRFATEVKGPVG